MAKRNESGKITLYLSNSYSNHKEVGAYDTLAQLRKEGTKMLQSSALCANGLPAKEYAYETKTGMSYGFLKGKA